MFITVECVHNYGLFQWCNTTSRVYTTVRDCVYIYTCMQGSPGDRGPFGSPGADGAPGERGDTGLSGAKGEKGLKVC